MTPAVPDPTVEALSEAEENLVAFVRTFETGEAAANALPILLRAARAAAPDALRVRIEALAAEWERDADERPAMSRRHIAQLRALLEDGA